MKIRTTFMGAALCAMVAACSSAPDTTARAEAIQKRADEIGKFVTQLYIQIEPFNGVPEVDVMTCPRLHQGDIPLSQMCTGTGDLEEVLLVVRDSANRVVNVIVEDRPGGGCIHVQIPGLQTGYTVSALAVVKGVPGATPYSVGRISEVVPAL